MHFFEKQGENVSRVNIAIPPYICLINDKKCKSIVINRKYRKHSLDEQLNQERLGSTYRIFGKIFRAYNGIAPIYSIFIILVWLNYVYPIFIKWFKDVIFFITA